MPRSSRSKSHKQSKHSSKEAKEYSDSEEDVKVKDRNGKEEGLVRVSRDSASGEKRKFASQLRDGKDLPGHGNGDVTEEYAVLKRRKEKTEGDGSDRWNGGGNERSDGLVMDKDTKAESLKSKELKGSVDSKSKSSRRHDSGSEKKEDNASLVVEKEESKGGSRVDSKRKSEKDSGRKESREIKEKDRGLDKEKKAQDAKDGEVARKQGSQSVDITEERQGKRGKGNIELSIQDELRNTDLEKEIEKRTRRRGDGYSDKDKLLDDARDSDDRRSSRGDRSKDTRHKDGSYGDKCQEDGERDSRHREDKYLEDGDKDNRQRDFKYRDDGEKDISHRDDKYREDTDRDNRHRDDKYREDGDRDNRYRDEKYREDGDRDKRRRDDKYREDGDKDGRHRDDKYREDPNRDNRHKEDKHREEVDRDSRQRDGKQRNDSDRDRDNRARDVRYRDEHSSRDRTGESDIKRSRDESNVADPHYRKSSNCDVSPGYDDRANKYKDDKGRRRTNDKDDHSDFRPPRTVKEHRSDADKRSTSSGKVDLVADRGRSNSRNTDVDVTLNHSRRRNSPSSSIHSARDNYRVTKPEELKFREYGYEERARHNVSSSREFPSTGLTEKISSSRSTEKSIQRDDSQFGDSAERRLRSDARASPLQIVDKSPSLTNADRRQLNRFDVKRTLDVEESGQRSGGSRDYSGRDGKGSRELLMETHPVDEVSQVDGDNVSVSSPFTRNGNFSGNSRSLLPPPFRSGVDSPLGFGSSEDENRGRSNNRHRRFGDANMGRAQVSAWKGVPNWPSPVANGFIPFQHGSPSVGFHPVMQQFPAPPMFGIRPTMELNHTLPYHIPDADRFPNHVRPLGWRNPVDDSGPPLHGWDANNSVFSDESHAYGRLDWDQSRSQMSSRGWDTSGDMWKGQNSGLSTDLTTAVQKEDVARSTDDEEQAQNEQNQSKFQAESVDIQSSDSLDRITPEALKSTPGKSPYNYKMSQKDDANRYLVYLSKLDISSDLAQPELYDKYTSLMDIDQNALEEEDNSKFIYVEEVLGSNVPDKISSASLFAAINDSVFQKAMSLYKKQREETGVINKKNVSSSNLENLDVVLTSAHDNSASNDKSGSLASGCDGLEVDGAFSNLNQESVDVSSGFQEPEVCPVTAHQNPDDPRALDIVEIQEEQVCPLDMTKMEVDPVSKQEVMAAIADDISSSPHNVEQSDALLPGNIEDVSESGGNHSANIEEKKSHEAKRASLLFSDVSSEAVMPESIESGSVNLSRIHHSPESTH